MCPVTSPCVWVENQNNVDTRSRARGRRRRGRGARADQRRAPSSRVAVARRVTVSRISTQVRVSPGRFASWRRPPLSRPPLSSHSCRRKKQRETLPSAVRDSRHNTRWTVTNECGTCRLDNAWMCWRAVRLHRGLEARTKSGSIRSLASLQPIGFM
jgi:hypothetical protein